MKKTAKEFMKKGWKLNTMQNNFQKNKSAKYAKIRRKKVLKIIGSKKLLIPSLNPLPNIHRKLIQGPNPDFIYLTGMSIDDIDNNMFLLINGSNNKSILYAKPPFPKTKEEFFLNVEKGEYWNGPTNTLQTIQKKTGIKTLPLNKLQKTNTINLNNNPELKREINFLRLKKDEFEILEIKKAIHLTKIAFDNLFRILPSSMNEKEIEVAFDSYSMLKGAGTGYKTIVGSGSNSTYIHWTKNNSNIKKNDIVLIDAGIQTDLMYTADITRTYPKSNKFTKGQKKVYKAVLELNKDAIKMCKKGTKFFDIHKATVKKLSEFLFQWGIIKKPVDEIYNNELYKRYMIHYIGHSLGIEVHDTISLSKNDYENLILDNGYIMTIEPGIYFRNDDLYVPKELRGFGVRIEDNVLINNNNPINLSKSIPKEIKDIERN